MTVNIRNGKPDGVIDAIVRALTAYQDDHPDKRINVYRQNSVSVGVRIVDPVFTACARTSRHEVAWQYLDALPEEIQSEISMLVLLAPDEMGNSLANIEFDDPLTSRL